MARRAAAKSAALVPKEDDLLTDQQSEEQKPPLSPLLKFCSKLFAHKMCCYSALPRVLFLFSLLGPDRAWIKGVFMDTTVSDNLFLIIPVHLARN